MKRSPLRRKSGRLRNRALSETARIKDDIQAALREIVIKRDGGCIFRDELQWQQKPGLIIYSSNGVPPCNGYRKDGALILQADHLITRGNSATYADPRLVVCVCKGHHGWKSVGSNLRKQQYDAIVRQLISKERVELWDKMEAQSWKPTKVNWQLELAALKRELAKMSV